MSDVMELDWPEVVELPEEIGDITYARRKGGRLVPCCSAGHCSVAFGKRINEGFCPPKWREAFIKAAKTLTTRAKRNDTVVGCNDDLSEKQRPLVYAAAWILCGYEVKDWPEAQALAAKAKHEGAR